MKFLGAMSSLFFFIFFSSAAVAQEVITVYPSNHAFKFVWSGKNAVYRSSDGKATMRCVFDRSSEGVDDAANPYVAAFFSCENGLQVFLKVFSESDEMLFALADKNSKIIAQVDVNSEKKSY